MTDNNMMILGENKAFSMDSHETRRNNNVLIVGASGAGKTRSFVIPNLLQAAGSYVISDPKGNLYRKYAPWMEKKGYVVKKLDFTDPTHSDRYNFFRYIHNEQDIVKVAHMLMAPKDEYREDPFWDESAQLLIQAVIAYLWERGNPEEQNLHQLLELIRKSKVEVGICTTKSGLDAIMDAHDQLCKQKKKESYACSTYNKVRTAANNTFRCILVTVTARLGAFDLPTLNEMMAEDDLKIRSLGRQKTALFVVVSDTDRSMDAMADLFFTQAMNELVFYADKRCDNNRLPVPVRFILDDFATNCRIYDFPRMISSIRSRDISAMLMIQSEAQLEKYYGHDGNTIIVNCDTYVYLGGNDLQTAKAVAKRCNVPLRRILYMPLGTNWVFRRGELPYNGRNYDPDQIIEKNRQEYETLHTTELMRE